MPRDRSPQGEDGRGARVRLHSCDFPVRLLKSHKQRKGAQSWGFLISAWGPAPSHPGLPSRGHSETPSGCQASPGHPCLPQAAASVPSYRPRAHGGKSGGGGSPPAAESIVTELLVTWPAGRPALLAFCPPGRPGSTCVVPTVKQQGGFHISQMRRSHSLLSLSVRGLQPRTAPCVTLVGT